MKQKTAVIISTIITTFSLVLLGGVAGRMSVDANPVTPNTVVETQQMPQNVNYVPAAPSNQPTLAITPDRAALVALNNAPGASLLQTPQLVDFEGAVAYEVLLDRATLYIDGNNGEVLYNSLIVSASLPAYNGEEYEEEEYEEEEHEEYEEEEEEDD
ncbi:MAG: hypothetical protein ACPGWR_01895 [Ardenticatenaceae bacterium]